MPSPTSARAHIIPVFLPMAGCSYRCIYCDQHTITTTQQPLLPAALAEHVAAYTATRKSALDVPLPLVAFYGGSFAQLPLCVIEQWIHAVAELEHSGKIGGFVCSARPDGWRAEIFELLRRATCQRVELGIQSTNQDILQRAGRPPITNSEISTLLNTLREHGISPGVQLMFGLPGENRHTWQATMQDTLAWQPDTLRLYPALVLAGTPLEAMWRQGNYQPPTLTEAVNACADAFVQCAEHGITVLRAGLQDSATLRQQIVAGPWHPAFGELIRSECYRRQLLTLPPTVTAIAVHPHEISALIGHGKSNNDLLTGLRVERDHTVVHGRIVWK